ncbi:MAG: hypothetical protein H0V92_07170 [Pseudonocardiales bacterium]|nr:hypothetical protein [Pseudonocardiales bacterium]
MTGWLPVRRIPRERPSAPLRGHKLAHPMVSADGTGAGFGGVTLGRASVYGVLADAQCAQGGRHRCPSRWCDCGFYCVHTLGDARALACDPDYRYAVLLEVAASGRYIRYERGLRYARQRVISVRVGRCACGHRARVLAETGVGTVGWRRLVAACLDCAGTRPSLTFGAFSRLLSGLPVRSDTGEPRAAEPTAPQPRQAEAEPSQMSAVPTEALVPMLTAEVALLQARLDEVQRQLARLTPP